MGTAFFTTPFQTDSFDFGDPGFLQAIYALGETGTRQTREFGGRRGLSDSVYVHRAFFGLYSLLSRLRARVSVTLPGWLRPAC